MLRKWAFLTLLFCLTTSACKPPELTPRDIRSKTEEILKAHVCHKALNPELMKRIFQNYLEELDPTKTYFLAKEVENWIEPKEEMIEKGLKGFKTTDFSLFLKLHAQLLKVIERRNKLETYLLTKPIPTDVKSEEFKDLSWAKDPQELTTRLLRIRALQLSTAEKMGDEEKSRLFQRIRKYRLNREAEWVGASQEESLKIVLSHLLKAFTSSLDSHTNYFTPAEANQFMIQVQQRLFGIGAQLRDDLNGLTIVRILDNSPASQSNKIRINDKIIAVNNEPVIGMNIQEAVELIRGEKGTPVLLTILRNSGEEEKLEIELTRGEVVLEESRLETTPESFGDGTVAILHLFSFYQDPNDSSASDIKKSIEELKAQGNLKGVILDLRGNAGGLLSQAVSVTGLFIHNGIVVSVKDNTGKLKHLRETEGNPIWNGPLVVLVNRASASAAEIVAQTLQDYGRALIVGDDFTFGKGSIQTLTLDPINHPKINPQGEYKVTQGKYYTVSGKSPQLTGVQSDIVIPGLFSYLDIGEKFSKYPLENDTVEPHFEDDLSDIPPFHRIQLGASYKNNLQPRLEIYDSYLHTLKQNSETRLKKNKNYQKFLLDIEKKNYDAPSIELFTQSDLQMNEAINIMKDLVYLYQNQSK
jgi:carboxyl-terminal processing protease